MRRHRSAFLFFPLALAACGEDFDLYDAEPEAFRTIGIWTEPSAEIPTSVVREACEAWRPEGVLCASVDDPKDARVLVRLDRSPCVEKPEGGYALGWASRAAPVVTLSVECLKKFGGDPIARDWLYPTVAHEVGHQLGIWTHVPTGCDPAPDDPDVQRLVDLGACGTALMNPTLHDGLIGITVIDHEAYLARDADHSVLERQAAEGDLGCVLKARE